MDSKPSKAWAGAHLEAHRDMKNFYMALGFTEEWYKAREEDLKKAYVEAPESDYP